MNEKLNQYLTNKFSGLATEIWNFNNNDKRIVDPVLAPLTYAFGIGAYLVPAGFCSKQSLMKQSVIDESIIDEATSAMTTLAMTESSTWGTRHPNNGIITCLICI